MNDDSLISYLVEEYTPEGQAGAAAGGFGTEYLFFVGRDDVHGILLYLLQHETLSVKLNMFGYDDPELNDTLMKLLQDPTVHLQISLDKSQAAGAHEKLLLAADAQEDPAAYATSFVIMQSATHQISHTKGAVLAAQGVYFEGSTNWSAAGEGTGIALKPGLHSIPGFKAQNNTLLVSTNPVNMRRFSTQLDVEHQTGLQQRAKAKAV